MIRKITALLVISCLSLEQCYAQVALPVNSLPSFSSGAEKVHPVHLRSLIFDRAQNGFDLVVDKGDSRKAQAPELRETAGKLMEYFLTGVSIPDSAFWVNLRPDSENEVIDPALEKTDLGKALLEADLALKKDMARATSPDTAEGKKYWSRLYAKAETLFGRDRITIPTIARPWIVPGEIIIRQSADSVYIYKATLGVRLEQDRLKGDAGYSFDDPRLKELNEYSTSLIKELILPSLIKKVNGSSSYAQLRQVFYSLILAQWFKKHFTGTGAEYAARINTGNLEGLTSAFAWSKSAYFDAYRKSFQDGEYNVSEKVAGGTAVRKYVSGGILPMPALEGAEAEGVTPIMQSTAVGVTPEGVVRLDAGTLTEVSEETVGKPLADGGRKGDVLLVGSTPEWDSLTMSLMMAGYNVHAYRNIEAARQALSEHGSSIGVVLATSDVKNQVQAMTGLTVVEVRDSDSASGVMFRMQHGQSAFRDGGAVNAERWIGTPFQASELNMDMFRDYDYRSTGFPFNPRR